MILTDIVLGSPNVLLGAEAPQLNLLPMVAGTAAADVEGREGVIGHKPLSTEADSTLGSSEF